MHTSRHRGPRQYSLRFLTPYRILVTILGTEKLCDGERTKLYRAGYIRCDDGIYYPPDMVGESPRFSTILRQSVLPRRHDVRTGKVAPVEAF